MKKFIPLTAIGDTSDTICAPRKLLLRADLVGSVMDISSGGYALGTMTRITTTEPDDFVNDRDETGGVIRQVRKITVQESLETVQRLLEMAIEGE